MINSHSTIVKYPLINQLISINDITNEVKTTPDAAPGTPTSSTSTATAAASAPRRATGTFHLKTRGEAPGGQWLND